MSEWEIKAAKVRVAGVIGLAALLTAFYVLLPVVSKWH
jgi:hypothetical protein